MPLSAVQIDELHADLKLHFRSDALTDAVSRGLYATDASVWQFEPLAVITPRHDDDVRRPSGSPASTMSPSFPVVAAPAWPARQPTTPSSSISPSS